MQYPIKNGLRIHCVGYTRGPVPVRNVCIGEELVQTHKYHQCVLGVNADFKLDCQCHHIFRNGPEFPAEVCNQYETSGTEVYYPIW